MKNFYSILATILLIVGSASEIFAQAPWAQENLSSTSISMVGTSSLNTLINNDHKIVYGSRKFDASDIAGHNYLILSDGTHVPDVMQNDDSGTQSVITALTSNGDELIIIGGVNLTESSGELKIFVWNITNDSYENVLYIITSGTGTILGVAGDDDYIYVVCKNIGSSDTLRQGRTGPIAGTFTGPGTGVGILKIDRSSNTLVDQAWLSSVGFGKKSLVVDTANDRVYCLGSVSGNSDQARLHVYDTDLNLINEVDITSTGPWGGYNFSNDQPMTMGTFTSGETVLCFVNGNLPIMLKTADFSVFGELAGQYVEDDPRVYGNHIEAVSITFHDNAFFITYRHPGIDSGYTIKLEVTGLRSVVHRTHITSASSGGTNLERPRPIGSGVYQGQFTVIGESFLDSAFYIDGELIADGSQNPDHIVVYESTMNVDSSKGPDGQGISYSSDDAGVTITVTDSNIVNVDSPNPGSVNMVRTAGPGVALQAPGANTTEDFSNQNVTIAISIDTPNADEDVNTLVQYVEKASSTTLSVPEVEKGTLSIYPNPVGETLHFSLPDGLIEGTVTFYSLLGQMVKKAEFIYGSNETINVSGMASGMYIVTLESANRIFSGKMIKK